MEDPDRENRENELTICELRLNIGNVSTWGCPGSKCIKQEKFMEDDSVTEKLEEFAISDQIKKLMQDIEIIFGRTAFPTFPLVLLPIVHLLGGWIYMEIQGHEEIKKILALYVILLVVPPLLYLLILFGFAYIFHSNRNNQVNDCLNFFNEASMPQGIHVQWNDSYVNYAHARLQRFWGSKYTIHIQYGQPALMVQMHIPARQRYCRENGLQFHN